MSFQNTVEEAIANHKIVIFSKSYCPFCKRAKGVFEEQFSHLKEQTYILELDEDGDGNEIQGYLKKKTGQGTVPNIFINKEHVGGCDDLMKLRSNGKLAGLVAA